MSLTLYLWSLTLYSRSLQISDDGEECIPMSEAEVKRQVDVLTGGKNKRQFKKPYVINIKRSVIWSAAAVRLPDGRCGGRG